MQAVLRAIDALDLDGAVALFAPDGSLTTVYGDTAAGRERCKRCWASSCVRCATAHHDVTSEWNPESGVWIAEMSATYELSDYSRRGPYQRAMILRAGDAGIEQLHIYGAHELPLTEAGRPYARCAAPHGWLPTL